MTAYRTVKLKKIAELDDAKHPNNIDTGREFKGICFGEPVVGERFWVGDMRTSTVREIISPSTFKTTNSVYEWVEVTSEQTA